jgi:hypothetical protein
VKLMAEGGRQSFYAFSSALALLKSGIKYYSFGWQLDASIRVASPKPLPSGTRGKPKPPAAPPVPGDPDPPEVD